MATTRDQYLLERYGITEARFLVIWAAQGEACAICRKKRKANTPNFHVDHDHKTGQIRGILCPRCNERLLTAARDDPELLRRAAEYLESEGWGQVPPDKLKSPKRNTRYSKAPPWLAPKGVERKL